MNFNFILFLMVIRILSLFIFLILLALTGSGVWNLYTGQVRTQEDVRGTSMITAAQTTIDTRALFTEYTSLVSLHLSNLYDGKETLSTKEQLDITIEEMGGAIETIGTNEDRQDFIKIFENHIEEYENYTTGLKEKNQQKMQTAKGKLAVHASELGKLVSKLLPSLPAGRGEDLMNQHTALMLAIVEAHAEKDTEKTLLLMKDASLQANLFADELINTTVEKENF